jgi:hypothetical protein
MTGSPTNFYSNIFSGLLIGEKVKSFHNVKKHQKENFSSAELKNTDTKNQIHPPPNWQIPVIL